MSSNINLSNFVFSVLNRRSTLVQDEFAQVTEAASRQRHEVRQKEGLARPQRDQRDCQR